MRACKQAILLENIMRACKHAPYWILPIQRISIDIFSTVHGPALVYVLWRVHALIQRIFQVFYRR